MEKIYKKGFGFRLISHKSFQTHRIINRSSSVSSVSSVVSSAGFGLHAPENSNLVLGLISHRPSGSNSLHNQKMFLFAPVCVVG
jgi:hypothetical protein